MPQKTVAHAKAKAKKGVRRKKDYDSPWKEALERRFPEFLELLFPHIHREVDWSRPPEFLDKELQKVVRDAGVGRRYADKLVKVWTLDAREIWVLIHVEVQGDADHEFPERMYIYNYRLFDWHRVDVVSLAVLTDTSPAFRPSEYQRVRWGCELEFRFPVVKLLDWEARWEELEKSDNVFSLVVMAQIKAKTSRNADEMRVWKLRLVRLMYERGYSKAVILELFRVIDWMIRLPDGLERRFIHDVYKIEEEKKMPYVTSAERFGIEKGVRKGVRKGVQKGSFTTLYNLVRNAAQSGYSHEAIAGIAGIETADVTKILNNEPIDMPAHLLKPRKDLPFREDA